MANAEPPYAASADIELSTTPIGCDAMNDLDTLRPEVQKALHGLRKCVLRCEPSLDVGLATIRAELLRLADENARLNKIESLATEQRLQMEDVELYLMNVSQPDDEDAPWCDRMKSAIELLVQDCNEAVGQKNKAEAELAALKARMRPVARVENGEVRALMDPADEGEYVAVVVVEE